VGIAPSKPLLHDGSAATIDDAIQRHGVEADLARRGFEQAGQSDRAALISLF
jgi:CxxC motif-containing protein (DUF1111 family)